MKCARFWGAFTITRSPAFWFFRVKGCSPGEQRVQPGRFQCGSDFTPPLRGERVHVRLCSVDRYKRLHPYRFPLILSHQFHPLFSLWPTWPVLFPHMKTPPDFGADCALLKNLPKERSYFGIEDEALLLGQSGFILLGKERSLHAG